MKKILAIGNSLSQDATAYLHNIAAAAGEESLVFNLYIGGCSLQRHWRNAAGDLPDYEYELNGLPIGEMGSIRTALLLQKWDEITLQQVSGRSGDMQSYEPFLGQLICYVRQYAPTARLWLHQTWAYETDSDHGDFPLYDCSQQKMYRSLCEAYGYYAKKYHLPLIPCGDIIQHLRAAAEFDYGKGAPSLCRDGFHLSLDYGRYAAAATWFECLFGKSVLHNTFLPSSQAAPNPARIALIQNTVHAVCSAKKTAS